MDQSPSPPDLQQQMMMTAAAHNKRYRPSPAKTFQCRGYGECRMVFSRSEHLARHVRKHTGERPFTCHCAKQFSRLDNLRQHAQTVHADKQDDNERMMRELTSLHATMSAANKLSGVRPARKNTIVIKQEDGPHLHRPDTSTGYEGGGGGEPIYSRNNNSSFRDSFRGPSQSFLGPSGTSPSSQSFLAYPGSQLQASDATIPKPATSSGLAHPRSLPPLSAVVSASLPSPPSDHSSPSQQRQQQQQQHQQLLFPFPSSLGQHHRRSSTHRPGTAPASASLFAPSSFPLRSRLGSSSGRPDLSLLHSGLGGPGRFIDNHHFHHLGDSPPDPSTNDSSPFFFNPPVSSIPSNPRKRPFGGPDGPASAFDEQQQQRPTSSSFPQLHYEYGSESRPQSRRLTLMELCNDEPRPPSQQQRSLLLSSDLSSSSSRPITSSDGLCSSTSTLRLFDRAASPSSAHPNPSSVFSRAPYPAGGTAGDGASSRQRGRGQTEGERGGRFASPSAFSTSTSSTPSPPPPVLSNPRQQQQQQQSVHFIAHSPTFSSASSATSNDSCSPRSPLSDDGPDSPQPPPPQPSFSSYASTRASTTTSSSTAALFASGTSHSGPGVSAQSHLLHHHHHHQRDAQVRATAVSPHPAGFGMRV